MSKTTYKTPHEISMLGFAALVERLGPGGAVQFVAQYEAGDGDYTEERRQLLKAVTLDGLKAKIDANRHQ